MNLFVITVCCAIMVVAGCCAFSFVVDTTLETIDKDTTPHD